MAAIMGGTMRAPFMATIFAIETTHAWGLLPPVFIGCIAATAFTVLFVSRSILTEKLARRGTHVFREYSVHPLELAPVSKIMMPREALAVLTRSATFQEIRSRLKEQSSLRCVDLPVIDANGEIAGFVGYEAIAEYLQHPEDESITIQSLLRPALKIEENARVRSAASMMAENGERVLAVVGDDGWSGIVTTAGLLQAWREGMAAETQRRRIRGLALER
jgi:CBS domain-containing protein